MEEALKLLLLLLWRRRLTIGPGPQKKLLAEAAVAALASGTIEEEGAADIFDLANDAFAVAATACLVKSWTEERYDVVVVVQDSSHPKLLLF